MNKKRGVLILVLVVVLIIGFYVYKEKPVCGNGIIEKGETNENCCIDVGCPEGFDCINNKCEREESGVGAADPSTIYCMEMGYEGKILSNENGEYAVCIFPDKSECDTWAFFRGKCGQEWSHCTLEGYDLKELGQYDGWVRGGICVDENTKEEVGTIYSLMDLKEKSSCKK